jgi:glycosyltransferase involved in cell wall biosynthesis
VIKLLAAKVFTGSPADGIDNASKAIFGRISQEELILEGKGVFEEKGALRKLSISRYKALTSGTYDGLWGIGHIRELLLVAFLPHTMKYFINFHTVLYRGSEGRWRAKTPWFLRKFIFSRADLIISPSEFSANTVRKYFPKQKVVSILNGVDINLFNPAKKNLDLLQEKYGIRAEKPLVAFVGTLQARKRPDVFIEIAKRVPGANFVMVGRVFPVHDFVKAAEGLENFQYIPAMPREDIAILFASSKAFIFPSLDEPSAAVILEAMASGAVPILSRSGGNGEYVKDGKTGFLINPEKDELEKFTAAVSSIIAGNVSSEIAMAARREAEIHTFDFVAEEYKNAILGAF